MKSKLSKNLTAIANNQKNREFVVVGKMQKEIIVAAEKHIKK